MLKQKVIDILTKKLGIDKFVLLTPKNSSFGDCAIHINQLKDKKIKIQDFVKQLKKEEIFEKVEEKSGFINFFISKKTLVKEIEKIIDKCYKRAVIIIKKLRKNIDRVAEELISKETIEGEDFEHLMGFPKKIYAPDSSKK